MGLHTLLEKRLIQNLLQLEACELIVQNSLLGKSYFLGFRKGVHLLDIERSIWLFFKVLGVLREVKKTKKFVLCLGFPFKEKPSLFFPRLQFFFNAKDWKSGILSNSTLLQKRVSFVLFFSQNLSFLPKESFVREIPSIGFLSEFNHKRFVDYPIFLNLHSKGAVGLYLYLLSQFFYNVGN